MDPREQALDELLSRHEIEQVILRLARATDRRDAEAIRACYHADAFDDHGAFQGGPAEFAEWVPKVLAPFAATQHFLAPPRIELEGDLAHCETYCTAHHVTKPDDPGGERDSVMGLRYLDRFERRLAELATPPPASATHRTAGGGVESPRRPHPPATYPVATRGVQLWRIARRTCVWDYTYIVPAADKWPLGPSFRLGRPDPSDPSYR
jgi:ketosteroid isomerase-like protein